MYGVLLLEVSIFFDGYSTGLGQPTKKCFMHFVRADTILSFRRFEITPKKTSFYTNANKETGHATLTQILDTRDILLCYYPRTDVYVCPFNFATLSFMTSSDSISINVTGDDSISFLFLYTNFSVLHSSNKSFR